MRKEKSHVSWWQVYVLGLGAIGLLVLGALVPISTIGHEVAALGTLLLVGGLGELWLQANAPALLQIERLIFAEQPQAEKTRWETLPSSPDEESLPASISRQQHSTTDAAPQITTVLIRQKHTG